MGDRARTIGAVGSPFLVALIRSWAEGRSFDPSVLPWVVVPVAAAGAFVKTLLARRFHRDEQSLATRDRKLTSRLDLLLAAATSLATNRKPRLIHSLEGHRASVDGVAWSPDGKSIASASSDHTVRIWETVTGQLIRSLEGYQHPVYSVAWSPDGSWLCSGSGDRTVCLWRAAE